MSALSYESFVEATARGEDIDVHALAAECRRDKKTPDDFSRDVIARIAEIAVDELRRAARAHIAADWWQRPDSPRPGYA